MSGMEPEIVLVTIPNVELLSVGNWNASTGPVTFTKDDLAAIVASQDDPGIHDPRLRIGHTSPDVTALESAGGFEEQPAFGRFTNLRLEKNGTVIVADAVGVPAWLAEVLPSAFPSRSVEVYHGYTTAAGKTHSCVVTSVALIGVSMPAVETLEDLQLAFGAEVPEGVEFTYLTKVEASKGEPMAKRTSASISTTDVRRSFYEELAQDDRYWWWLCDVFMSPSTVIADDDEGGLWSIAYTLKGDDAVEWGEPVEVRIQYVELGSGKVAASRLAAADPKERLSFRMAADSRPTDRVRAAQPEGSPTVDGAQIRELLELPADATDEQVNEKLAANKADAAKAEALETENAQLKEAKTETEDGSVVVDEETFAQLKKQAEDGATARAEQVTARQVGKVDAAIETGKVMPSRRDHYLQLMSKDEQGTSEFLDKLEGGVVPVKERGVGDDAQINGDGGAKPLGAVLASFGIKQPEPVATGKGN